jgi:hypothetical protein
VERTLRKTDQVCIYWIYICIIYIVFIVCVMFNSHVNITILWSRSKCLDRSISRVIRW